MSGRNDLFGLAERLMGMDDRVWARHANPLSVHSRIAGGTLVFLALWSPFLIGWWGIAAIAAAMLWIRLNPRLFAPPGHTRSWATRGVLGERAFLNRRAVPIPETHRRMALLTSAIAAAFLCLAALGFLRRDFWTAFAAWHGATVAKLWFVDRMVWLWDDMKDANETYRAWDRVDWPAAGQP